MFKKILAGFLASAVVLLSPGLECYAQIKDIGGSGVQDAAAYGANVPGAGTLEGLSQRIELGGLNPAQGLSQVEDLSSLAAPPQPAIFQASAPEGRPDIPSLHHRWAPGLRPAGVADGHNDEGAPSSPGAALEPLIAPQEQSSLNADKAALGAAAPQARPENPDERVLNPSARFSGIRERVLLETRSWHGRTAPETIPGSEHRGQPNLGLAELPPRLLEGAALQNAEVPPSSQKPAAPNPEPRGILARLKAWMGRVYNIFPDKRRNGEFWRYNIAQVIITTGSDFYTTVLPAFVAPTKALSGRMGMVRAATQGSQMVADVAMGPSIDQKPTSSFLFKSYLGRGIVLAAIPLSFFLFFHGGLFPTVPLIGLLVAMSFLQSAGVLAANVGYNRLLGSDQAYYNKANAANSLIVNLAGVVSPPLAGAFIAWAGAKFGASAGNVLSFGVYGLAAVATALIYRKLTLVNRDPASGGAKMGWLAALRGASSIDVRSWPKALRQKEKAAAELFSEIKKGFLLFWHDGFLRLYMIFSTASLFVDDAIFFLALPGFISKLGKAGLPAFMAHLPLVGHALAGFLGSPSAIFGLFIAASSLGTAVFNAFYMLHQTKPSAAPSKNGDPAAEPARVGILSAIKAALARMRRALDSWLVKKFGPDITPMQKQGVWSSIVNGLGWVAGLALFLTSHVWLALGAMAFSAFLQSPSVMIWESLQQDILNTTYRSDQAKIWSAISLFSQVFTIAGDLIFGVVMAKLSLSLGLGLVMGTMGLCAVLAVIQPFVIFRPRPIKGGPKA